MNNGCVWIAGNVADGVPTSSLTAALLHLSTKLPLEPGPCAGTVNDSDTLAPGGSGRE